MPPGKHAPFLVPLSSCFCFSGHPGHRPHEVFGHRWDGCPKWQRPITRLPFWTSIPWAGTLDYIILNGKTPHPFRTPGLAKTAWNTCQNFSPGLPQSLLMRRQAVTVQEGLLPTRGCHPILEKLARPRCRVRGWPLRGWGAWRHRRGGGTFQS